MEPDPLEPFTWDYGALSRLLPLRRSYWISIEDYAQPLRLSLIRQGARILHKLHPRVVLTATRCVLG